MSMKPVFLSVDFDFFSRECLEWDFGHREDGPFFEEMIWKMREVGFKASGIDLRKETSLEFSNPKPHDFWNKLVKMGFDFSHAFVFTGNSHAFAAASLCQFLNGKPARLINFDAHHDLGYHKTLSRKMWKQNQIEAGSWLGGLLTKLNKLSAEIVYPGWKGLNELKYTDPVFGSKKSEKSRVKFSIFDESKIEPGLVKAIYIAKSPCWVPPWHDEEFINFVESIEEKCLNLNIVKDDNPMKVRNQQ